MVFRTYFSFFSKREGSLSDGRFITQTGQHFY
uniref:Uncharacterized protein n=1 Tax=Anguilla anguilla TaxID=7936 RepID=A0A0E9UMY0_ANGAN